MAKGHGGARKGAGRPKKAEVLRAAIVTMQDQMPGDVLSIVLARLKPGANSLELIQHVYSAPETPSDLKLKLAVAAMPFEVPKPDAKTAKSKSAPEEITEKTDEHIDRRVAELLGKAGAAAPARGEGAKAQASKD